MKLQEHQKYFLLFLFVIKLITFQVQVLFAIQIQLLYSTNWWSILQLANYYGSHLIASSTGSNEFFIYHTFNWLWSCKIQVTMGDDPNNTGNGRCGNAIFTKNIWVGKPYVFGANPNPNELEYFVDDTTCPVESTTLCCRKLP